jgi:hypothetical protein
LFSKSRLKRAGIVEVEGAGLNATSNTTFSGLPSVSFYLAQCALKN